MVPALMASPKPALDNTSHSGKAGGLGLWPREEQVGGTGTGSYRTLFLLFRPNTPGTTRNFVPFVPFVPTSGVSFKAKARLNEKPKIEAAEQL